MSGKLVRDKIPEFLIKLGKNPRTYIADDMEFRQRLKDKLLEECQEYIDSENPEELADILEVIEALRMLHQLTVAELDKIKQGKTKARGGFTQKIIMEEM